MAELKELWLCRSQWTGLLDQFVGTGERSHGHASFSPGGNSLTQSLAVVDQRVIFRFSLFVQPSCRAAEQPMSLHVVVAERKGRLLWKLELPMDSLERR